MRVLEKDLIDVIMEKKGRGNNEKSRVENQNSKKQSKPQM